jgi:hypothetical protein
MQHLPSWATAAFCVIFLTAPAHSMPGHKGHSGYGGKNIHGHHVKQVHPYRAPMSTAGGASGGHGPDAPRLPVQAIAQPAPNTLVLPIGPSQLPPRQVLGIASETHPHAPRIYQQPLPDQRRLEMLSGQPVGPNTVLSELPSGRIVMQSFPFGYRAHGQRRYHRSNAGAPQPYAPPTFHMIGEPSQKHMGRAVKLTYGTEMRKRFNPAPRVVWIKAEQQGRTIHVIK